MDRELIVETLRCHQAELRLMGIAHLSLFGSAARGTGGQDSDVDLMAELDQTQEYSLLSLVHMEDRLRDVLGHKVDFSVRSHMRSAVRANAETEAVVAF